MGPYGLVPLRSLLYLPHSLLFLFSTFVFIYLFQTSGEAEEMKRELLAAMRTYHRHRAEAGFIFTRKYDLGCQGQGTTYVTYHVAELYSLITQKACFEGFRANFR
jgi:hypothetical protein